MDIYSNAIQDERVRCYLPVTRIMTEKIFLGAEALVTPPLKSNCFYGEKRNRNAPFSLKDGF